VRLRAFEPFFTTKGPGKGTGLGLSMVFGFATMSGGSAVVQSAPGAGTTVRIFLPEATAQDLPADHRQALGQELEAAQKMRSGQRILLVDDDADVRSTIQAMLEDLGYTIVVAEDATAALAVLRTDRSFDLLVIDFVMPDMNGSQLADAVRADWPDAPLMFISGYVENDALMPWRTQDILMLSKPFSQPDLSSTVRQTIERQAATSRLRGPDPAQPNAVNNSSSALN
jgi:CheY-like chemotaxis protein